VPLPYEFAFDLGGTGDETWVEYQLSLAPPWLLRTWGARFLSILGNAKGHTADMCKAAVKARFVDIGPHDALPYQGADRVVIRAPDETDAAYRARLLESWSTWGDCGKEAGFIDLLAVAGITAVLVEDQDVGGALGHWARFYLYVEEPNDFTAAEEYGSFTWGSFAWGTGPISLIEYARNVVRLFKPAHTRCLGITVSIAGAATPYTIEINDDDIGIGAPLPDSLTDESYIAIVAADGEPIVGADAF
jgi:hypothetical protein